MGLGDFIRKIAPGIFTDPSHPYKLKRELLKESKRSVTKNGEIVHSFTSKKAAAAYSNFLYGLGIRNASGEAKDITSSTATTHRFKVTVTRGEKEKMRRQIFDATVRGISSHQKVFKDLPDPELQELLTLAIISKSSQEGRFLIVFDKLEDAEKFSQLLFDKMGCGRNDKTYTIIYAANNRRGLHLTEAEILQINRRAEQIRKQI